MFRDIRPGDRYSHFKTGTVYKIVSLFTWEPTKEEAVLYENEATGERWGRTLRVFMEDVADPKTGQPVNRFTKISSADDVVVLYQLDEKIDAQGQPYFDVLAYDGQPVLTLRGGNAGVIVLSFLNMSRNSHQRGSDYMAGVIQGCCHMILVPQKEDGVGSTKPSPLPSETN